MHEVTAHRVAMDTNSPDYFWTGLTPQRHLSNFLYHLFLIGPIHYFYHMRDAIAYDGNPKLDIAAYQNISL